MDLFNQFLQHLVSVAVGYYLFATVILLTHCMFDEGVVWNSKKKWILLFLVMLNEVVDIIWKESLFAEIPLILCYFFLFAYGCGEKHIRRGLKVFGLLF